MDRVPEEVLIRHASRKASEYFANRIEEERKNGRVAVLVRNLMDSLFFLPCTKEGYPDYYMYRSLHIPNIHLATPIFENEGEDISRTATSEVIRQLSVEEFQVIVERPLVSQSYDWREKPVIFLWEGRCMNREKIPIERLNVSELLKLAQNAIMKREGLIIDEATKNKIYK